MRHERQTQFGRPVTAVQSSDVTLVDKWQVLQDLSDGAESLGLNHRTLGVLRALLTFHRERYIGPEPLSAVVFPSNKTLSHRLNGMPESTLRRHLCLLVETGVVIRHDSANRKRFKRRAGDAYGFDLAPLAQNAGYIAGLAATAQATRDRLANLRDRVAQARQCLLEEQGACTLTEAARIMLRRKPEESAFLTMLDQLTAKRAASNTKEMSAPDSENERHLQSESLIRSAEPVQKKETTKTTSEPILTEVLEQCREYRLYFPERVRHWNDAFNIANRLSTMMGIEQSTFCDAVARIGKKQVVAVIFNLLDQLPTIDNPGGYLRRIAQIAGQGAKLSADNL